ncbi:MAG: twin-arginine translocation signal domain-containing protein, partial [Chloroflexi bacterium]
MVQERREKPYLKRQELDSHQPPNYSEGEICMFKKEMNRRDFLKVSTIAAGAAALAACAPAAATQQPAEGGAAAPAGEQITLVQYYHEYGEKGCAEASQRYAEEYTTVKSNVKVERQWIPGDYGQKLSAALLTDQAPDVWESGPDAAR